MNDDDDDADAEMMMTMMMSVLTNFFVCSLTLVSEQRSKVHSFRSAARRRQC